MQLEEKLPPLVQVVYIALASTTLPLGKIPIAAQSEPHKMCGMARRIGYTGSSTNDLALYHLKLNTPHTNHKITLPGDFVLEHGRFRVYHQS